MFVKRYRFLSKKEKTSKCILALISLLFTNFKGNCKADIVLGKLNRLTCTGKIRNNHKTKR